jgi:DUF1365 family protein
MRVAVVGTGIAGNAAAWTLSKYYPVTVYDRELRPGGHSHTVAIDCDGTRIAVDIGFIVYNELNYPDLTALFAHLDVETVESCMSFAVTADTGRFEWKGGGNNWLETAKGLFAQPRNLLSPSYLWMLRDILTFNQQSVADYAAAKLAGLTLGEYFKTRHFALRLLTDYLAPMGAAIWSAPASEMRDFPAENFVAFFSNHRLLQYDRPVTAAFRDRIRLGCAVTSIERTSHGVVVHDNHGKSNTYDHVVIASHSDQALAMLSDADDRERSQGDPVDAAAALYVGKVMHARLKPIGHRFSYRVMSLLIDLDRLAAADRQSALFGVNRAALYSFNEADHGERDGSSLRQYAQACAAARGIDLASGRVLLLCYPRLLGYTFNPLSVYFCYRAGGELALVIYEVRNTFGELHAYALPVKQGEISDSGLRQSQEKFFYVSPFIEMAMRYHFRVAPPADSIRLRILETDRDGPLLAATFNGRRRALNTGELLRSVFSLPLVTLKIVAAIHWEALRLWLKGARLVPRQNAASNSGLAIGRSNDYTSPALSARGKK